MKTAEGYFSDVKKQEKIAEKQLNEEYISNFPGKKKFRIMIMILQMMQDLRKIMKIQEMFTKDLEELKNK